MNTYHRFVRLVPLVLITLVSLLMVAHSAEKPAPPKGAPSNRQAALRERGRYPVILGGCNDCHTAGFAQSGGTTPESEWLTGDTVGWRGPWGTTYAPNLRLLMQSLSEDGWVQFAHTVNGRPPMPFWTLHTMTAPDLRAMYQFIKRLGPKGVAAPPGLPPDQEPKTPYILFVPQAPK